METLFNFLSFSPGPFWLLILIVPTNRRAMLVFDTYLLLLSTLFVWQTLPVLGTLLPMLAQPKFDEMHAFLSSKEGFVGSWNHMILADLWIGRWVAQDSVSYSRPLLVRLVFLPIILFVGPVGLFCYLLFRVATLRRFALTEA